MSLWVAHDQQRYLEWGHLRQRACHSDFRAVAVAQAGEPITSAFERLKPPATQGSVEPFRSPEKGSSLVVKLRLALPLSDPVVVPLRIISP